MEFKDQYFLEINVERFFQNKEIHVSQMDKECKLELQFLNLFYGLSMKPIPVHYIDSHTLFLLLWHGNIPPNKNRMICPWNFNKFTADTQPEGLWRGDVEKNVYVALKYQKLWSEDNNRRKKAYKNNLCDAWHTP